MILQTFQLAGAITVLVPFIAVQFGRLHATDVGYLLPNLAGSVVLVGVALSTQNWGFVILESVWTVVSGGSLVRRLRLDSASAREPR